MVYCSKQSDVRGFLSQHAIDTSEVFDLDQIEWKFLTNQLELFSARCSSDYRSLMAEIERCGWKQMENNSFYLYTRDRFEKKRLKKLFDGTVLFYTKFNLVISLGFRRREGTNKLILTLTMFVRAD